MCSLHINVVRITSIVHDITEIAHGTSSNETTCFVIIYLMSSMCLRCFGCHLSLKSILFQFMIKAGNNNNNGKSERIRKKEGQIRMTAFKVI